MPEVNVCFRCPICGGDRFGTAFLETPNEYGYCSGTDDDHGSRSCPFRWPRSDDWRYFVRVTVEPFASREEYEAAS